MAARRAIDFVRRSALEARRVPARADAILSARRALARFDVEGAPPRRDGPELRLGRYVSIAHAVETLEREPGRSERVAQFPLRERLGLGAGEPRDSGPVSVGPDAWVGAGSVVMAGVTIGPGAVVATRSVVTEDVAPYAIVAGVPATQIGRRFDDARVAALLRIAWWDWPPETIAARVDLLSSPDVDAFIAAYDPGAG